MPPFPLAKALVDAYFERPHFCAPMINRARFLTAFTSASAKMRDLTDTAALAPTSQAYPSFALIHAILALACSFVSEDFAGLPNETYWRSSGSAAEHHSRAAKVRCIDTIGLTTQRWIDDSIVRGAHLFQVSQAIILVCFSSYASARFVEVWLYSGCAGNLSTSLTWKPRHPRLRPARTEPPRVVDDPARQRSGRDVA